MDFFSFLVLVGVAYLIWRISDQLPDLIFRISEIQRDIAEIRRRLADTSTPATGAPPAASSTPRSAD